MSRAVLEVTSGPNAGDKLSLEMGTCRLIGRHLSEAETAFIDRDGNRVLDGSAADIITDHLQEKAPEIGTTPKEGFSATAFERGPDIVFADDSVSRAHAMVFFDEAGVGIIDLASTNGTFVSSDRVASAIIEPGQDITIGKSDIAVRLE